jgi:hypothetical protein
MYVVDDFHDMSPITTFDGSIFYVQRLFDKKIVVLKKMKVL